MHVTLHTQYSVWFRFQHVHSGFKSDKLTVTTRRWEDSHGHCTQLFLFKEWIQHVFPLFLHVCVLLKQMWYHIHVSWCILDVLVHVYSGMCQPVRVQHSPWCRRVRCYYWKHKDLEIFIFALSLLSSLPPFLPSFLPSFFPSFLPSSWRNSFTSHVLVWLASSVND